MRSDIVRVSGRLRDTFGKHAEASTRLSYLTGLWARDVTKPYEYIGFGDIYGPKPYKFKGFSSFGCWSVHASVTAKLGPKLEH